MPGGRPLQKKIKRKIFPGDRQSDFKKEKEIERNAPPFHRSLPYVS